MSSILRAPEWPVAGDIGFEVSEAVPVEPLVEIHFGHDYVSPLFGSRDRFALVIVDRRQHPVPRDVFISAAHDIDVIFAGAGAC